MLNYAYTVSYVSDLTLIYFALFLFRHQLSQTQEQMLPWMFQDFHLSLFTASVMYCYMASTISLFSLFLLGRGEELLIILLQGKVMINQFLTMILRY